MERVKMYKMKFLIIGLVLCLLTTLNAEMNKEVNSKVLDTTGIDGIAEINPSTDVKSPPIASNGKIIYAASKNDRSYLAATDEAASYDKIISPSYTMINSIAVCPANKLIAYATRDQRFNPGSFIKIGIEGESKILGKNMIPEDFSKDCKTLIYTSADKKSYLYSYNVETGKSNLLLKMPVLSANFSPDNNLIVLCIMSGENGAGDLYMLYYPSLKLKRLTKTPKINEINPVFLNKDIIIMGTSEFASGDWKLSTYNLKTDRVSNLIINGKADMLKSNYAAVSESRRKILYVNDRFIHVIDIISGEDKIIIRGQMPQWYIEESLNSR